MPNRARVRSGSFHWLVRPAPRARGPPCAAGHVSGGSPRPLAISARAVGDGDCDGDQGRMAEGEQVVGRRHDRQVAVGEAGGDGVAAVDDALVVATRDMSWVGAAMVCSRAKAGGSGR